MKFPCEEVALKAVAPECAAHVLNYFSPTEGYPPGSFVGQLIKTFTLADPINGMKLSIAFPEYFTAVHLAQDHALGMDTLRVIAQKENA